jgi:hypothetical protein
MMLFMVEDELFLSGAVTSLELGIAKRATGYSMG